MIINLDGPGGNAHAVVGAVARVLRDVGRRDLVEDLRAQAYVGTYDQLLDTCKVCANKAGIALRYTGRK